MSQGSYGSVLKADYLGTIVAVKQLDLEEVGEEDVMKYIGREEAMTSYAHPNLVQVRSLVTLRVNSSFECKLVALPPISVLLLYEVCLFPW